ncbi:phosphoribosylaminoimidazolesuccinocarboxamide synthase, partial [Staphylococcus warneri]
MLKQALLYTGKEKSVYETDSADHLILVFRDDASAFNGEKIEQLDRK